MKRVKAGASLSAPDRKGPPRAWLIFLAVVMAALILAPAFYWVDDKLGAGPEPLRTFAVSADEQCAWYTVRKEMMGDGSQAFKVESLGCKSDAACQEPNAPVISLPRSLSLSYEGDVSYEGLQIKSTFKVEPNNTGAELALNKGGVKPEEVGCQVAADSPLQTFYKGYAQDATRWAVEQASSLRFGDPSFMPAVKNGMKLYGTQHGFPLIGEPQLEFR